MISKAELNKSGFTTINAFFQHIFNLKTKGQNKQVLSLVKKMSNDQKLEFSYFLGNERFTAHTIELKSLLIEVLCNNI